MAEDPSRILMAEGISNDTSSIELSDNICSQQYWRVHTQFSASTAAQNPACRSSRSLRLGSVDSRTKRITNDSIEEISDSNEPLSPGERSRE
jgi:hypothetical protein